MYQIKHVMRDIISRLIRAKRILFDRSESLQDDPVFRFEIIWHILFK